MAPRPEVTRLVRNQSSRNGQKPRLIVVHSTESHNRPGLSDLEGLGVWFDNPNAQASSHVANDAEGNDARFVLDERKAWTQAAYNPVSLSIEQVGQAAQKTWPEAQLKNSAAWVAYWSKKYDIPIVFSTTYGVCEHRHLGAAGGGHHDCGPDYPLEKVLNLAMQIDPARDKRRRWQKRLDLSRAQLRSLLALRARLRQRKLEQSAEYKASTGTLSALRKRITKLKRLVTRR